MAESSNGLMKSSIMPLPANRIGAVQTDAAMENKMYFMVSTPLNPAFWPDFVSEIAIFAIL